MESFSKTEYVVTYHCKSGRLITETYNDYGTALFAADASMEDFKDFRDWYEIKEIFTSEKIVKSTK